MIYFFIQSFICALARYLLSCTQACLAVAHAALAAGATVYAAVHAGAGGAQPQRERPAEPRGGRQARPVVPRARLRWLTHCPAHPVWQVPFSAANGTFWARNACMLRRVPVSLLTVSLLQRGRGGGYCLRGRHCRVLLQGAHRGQGAGCDGQRRGPEEAQRDTAGQGACSSS